MIHVRLEVLFKCGSLTKGLFGFDLSVNLVMKSLNVCLCPCKNNLIGLESTLQRLLPCSVLVF